MALIKDKHNDLFKKKVDQLRADIGRDIYVYKTGASQRCSWCVFDEMSGKSSGIPETGVDWTAHLNYKTDLVCPNCNGEGIVSPYEKTTVKDVIIDDKSGIEFFGKSVVTYPKGTKSLIGKLEDILTDVDDVDSVTILEQSDKIVVDGQDYILKNLSKIGLKDLYLFEAEVRRITDNERNDNAL